MSVNVTSGLNRGHRSFALLPVLLASIGLLVFIALGMVLALHWITGRTILRDFSGRLIDQGLMTQEMALGDHLRAAVNQAAFVAAAVESGRYHLFEAALGDFVTGAMAAAPQIDVVLIAAADGRTLRVMRGRQQTATTSGYFDFTGDPRLAAIAREIAEHQTANWGKPVYSEITRSTYLNYRLPIRRGASYLGFVAVTISTEALSRLAARLSDPPRSLSFMLYGSDAVLAHPLLIAGSAGRSEEEPLPKPRDLGDPVIEDIVDLPPITAFGFEAPTGTSARRATIGEKRYLVFTRPISGYAELPVTVGFYNLASLVDAPLRLFYWASVLALAMIVLALAAAVVIARTIARPIKRAATGAASIGNLDFDKVAALPRSRLREIDDLAQAFNVMLDGLKAFGRYVPRGLVNRLIKEGSVAAGSQQRRLAIMFTDIAGFTMACEGMTASQVADFINHHLTLVSQCIESEGGTIDKYIGDAAMAFWGAPGKVDNPAVAACRAGLAIKHAMAADNQKRLSAGLGPVRLRIGIHLGDVIVGDIGAPSRINYTIVGDAVNATQRLEALGKSIDPDAPLIVLISGDVAAALPPRFRLLDHGSQRVKGKQKALHVFELAGEGS